MRTILFIHQAAELYGSDKTLLLLIKNLDPKQYKAVVLLPFDGPLRPELEACNAEVHIAPVLKLYRKMFTPLNLLRFFNDINKGIAIVKKLHKQNQFDFIYSNTLAVLLGVFTARKLQIPHLWHVHEIIESPGIFRKTFGKLLALRSTTSVVYNSKATADFWNATAPLASKSCIIHNGLELPKSVSETEVNSIRDQFFHATTSSTVFALVGRISRWKGQLTALEAFEPIAREFPQTRLLFIGSAPPNQEHFEETLHREINEKGLQNQVYQIPFQQNIQAFWAAIDVALVPSTEPEPFGLVAVEAMLAGKPVIASNHGGLTEIVVSGSTGYLLPPNDSNALTRAMREFVVDVKKSETMGNAGKERAHTCFSIQSYVNAFDVLFKRIA